MRISDWSSDVCSSDLSWSGRGGAFASPIPRAAAALEKENCRAAILYRSGFEMINCSPAICRIACAVPPNGQDHGTMRMSVASDLDEFRPERCRSIESEIGRAHV